MKRLRLFFHNYRLFTCFIILFFFLFYLSYTFFEKDRLNIIESFFKDNISYISKLFSYKIEVDYHEITNLLSEEKEEELKSLKEILNLKNNTSFDLVNTEIIGRDAIFYFSSITVDKGKNDGIDKGMLAINENGLVGVVDYVTKNTSVISLISRDSIKYKIAVKVINGNDIYNGVITGYDVDNDEIIVESIRSNSTVGIGNKVLTNGLGGVYPKDIEVGQVVNIEMDKVGLNKILRIKSKVDFRNIRYISIIKGNTI